jgi:hypothetical protein
LASDLKENILSQIEVMLKNKLDTYNEALQGLKNDLNSASKSSAGDKHETGRAMVHLEQEKMGKQVLSAQKDLKTLHMMRKHESKKITIGSLIVTDSSLFLLGIGLGMTVIEKKRGGLRFYALSYCPKADPIGHW